MQSMDATQCETECPQGECPRCQLYRDFLLVANPLPRPPWGRAGRLARRWTMELIRMEDSSPAIVARRRFNRSAVTTLNQWLASYAIICPLPPRSADWHHTPMSQDGLFRFFIEQMKSDLLACRPLIAAVLRERRRNAEEILRSMED